jgi:hypothetical protein
MHWNPSFGAAFNAAQALQVVISDAFRSRGPLSLDQTVDAILAEFPDCGMSRNELWTAALDAAEQAGVRVTGNDTARSLRRPPRASERSGASPGPSGA